MKYKGLYISQSDAEDIVREIDGVVKECEGLYFQVYADREYDYEIGDFAGAYGVDIENSTESIEQFVRNEVNCCLETYKREQIYALIDKEYNSFEEDVRFSKDFDIIRDAEKIASMKLAHEYLTKQKPLDSETTNYLLNTARPLETVCDYLQHNKSVVYETIDCGARNLFEKQIEKYEKDDSYDFENEDDEEELEE